MGSDPTAAGGGRREGSEWQRSARDEGASAPRIFAGHRNRTIPTGCVRCAEGELVCRRGHDPALRGAVGVKKGRVKTLPYGMKFRIYHSLVCRWGGVKKVLDFPTGGVSFSHPAAALAGIPLTGKAELPGFCRHKCRKGRFFCPGIECPAGADLFGKIKRFMNRNGHCGGIGRRAADCRPYGVRGIVGSAEVESGWRMADGHPYIVHCPFSIVHSQAPTGAVEL